MIVHVGGADQPGTYYYYDTAVGAMSMLAKISDKFGPKVHLSPVRTIRYKARDGLEIAAVLTMPAGRDAKDLPLIRSEEHTSELQSLMRISYAIFCLKTKQI